MEKPTLGQRDLENAIFDVAAINTGLKTDCFIALGKSDDVRVGDPVISIGFPGSATSGVLYAGFLSAKHNHVPTVIGPVKDTTDFRSVSRDIFRVQMPVTAGASGSPVIDDNNKVVAVVSEIPVVWTTELSGFIHAVQSGGTGSIVMSGFNTTAILAQLALIVKEFESPGAGLAVPISYLRLPPATQSPKP